MADVTRNMISGGFFFSAVVQGRDITVHLPPQVQTALAGLPAPSKVFAGRDGELDNLMGLLRPAGPMTGVLQVSAVAGLGGAGKTELVLQAAHAALEKGWFAGGVLFVDMFGYDPRRKVEPGTALEGMLRAAGIPGEHLPAELQDRSRLFSSVMAAYADRGRDVLVVIDNVSASAQVRPLLPGSGNVVITSRHTLADLDARLLDLEVLTMEAAVELLAGQLHLVRGAADTRVADDPEDAVTIAGLCGRLPLALRIVAALLAQNPYLPLAVMAADLNDARTRLDEIRYGAGDDELAVRAAFDLSYRHLDQEQARVFRLLTANPGPDLSTKAAAVMAGLDERAVRRVLEELARAHMIERASAYGRWRMHDLVRIYAEELGRSHSARDGRPQAFARLMDSYLTSTRFAALHLGLRVTGTVTGGFPDREQAVAWMDAEYGNLTAAVYAAADSGDHTSIARDLPLAMAHFFSWRRHLNDWIALTRIAKEAACRLGDQRSEGYALTNLGLALTEAYQFQAAVTTCEEALRVFRDLGDRHGEGQALVNLGLAYQGIRQFDDSVTALQQAALIHRELGDRYSEGLVHTNLGFTFMEDRRFAFAMIACGHAIEIFHEFGDRRGEGKAQINLGLTYQEVGQWDNAVTALQRAAQIYRELGDQYSEGTALLNLGSTLWQLERPDDAITACQEALRIFRDFNDRPCEGQTLINLGLALQTVERFDDAIGALQAAAQICRDSADKDGEGTALLNLGGVLVEVERPDDAIPSCQQALLIFRGLGDRHAEGKVLLTFGGALQHAERFDDAITASQQAVQAFRDTGDRDREAATLLQLGNVLDETQRLSEAITTYQECAKIFHQIGEMRGECFALNDLGTTLQKAGRLNDAITVLQLSVDANRRAGDQEGEGRALNRLGSALRDAARFEPAIIACQQAAEAFRRADEQESQARALTGLGLSLQAAGMFDDAVTAFRRAAQIFHSIGDLSSEDALLKCSLDAVEQARRAARPILARIIGTRRRSR